MNTGKLYTVIRSILDKLNISSLDAPSDAGVIMVASVGTPPYEWGGSLTCAAGKVVGVPYEAPPGGGSSPQAMFPLHTFSQALAPTNSDIDANNAAFWWDTGNSRLYLCHNHAGTIYKVELT